MATTPTSPQRNVKGAPDTTKPATLTASKSRTPTHEIQGPAKIGEGDGRAMTTPSGPPPLHGTAPADVKPKEQKP